MDIQPTALLRIKQFSRNPVPYGVSTIWKMVREGRFPPPIRLSSRTTVWRGADILAWLAEKAGNPALAAAPAPKP